MPCSIFCGSRTWQGQGVVFVFPVSFPVSLPLTRQLLGMTSACRTGLLRAIALIFFVCVGNASGMPGWGETCFVCARQEPCAITGKLTACWRERRRLLAKIPSKMPQKCLKNASRVLVFHSFFFYSTRRVFFCTYLKEQATHTPYPVQRCVRPAVSSTIVAHHKAKYAGVWAFS